MTKAKTPKVKPTYTGYIGTSKDALIIFQAVLSGVLTPVHRRPAENERSELVKSGNVFVFIEETSRIKRWTDGISWSPSRILGRFLIYRELSKTPNSKGDDQHNSKSRHFSYMPEKLLNPETKNPKGKSETESSNLKTTNFPITAYAMAGGREIISGINNKKRPRADSSYKHDDNSSGASGNNSETHASDNNDNNVSSNIMNTTINHNNSYSSMRSQAGSDMHSETLDDAIYKTDGLIKKSNSLTLYTSTSYKKTMHIVSYYRSGDVLEHLLEKPSEDESLKDVEISFDLLEALRNTSLGHAIPSKKSGEFSIESHGFMDTDGFDEDSILKFAKEYYNKYNAANKRRQVNPVVQSHDAYRINTPANYYLGQNVHSQFPNPQILEYPLAQSLNQYHYVSYLAPQTQQQQQLLQQQQQQQQQQLLPPNNYSYKYDYTYLPVHDQQQAIPMSTPLTAMSSAYIPNPPRAISETLVASHSSRIDSPPSNGYGHNCTNQLMTALPVKNQRSASDEQFIPTKLPQLHQPLNTRPNYDIYPYGASGTHVMDPQQQQQQQKHLHHQQQMMHAQAPHPPPPPILQTPNQDQPQIHTRTRSPNHGPGPGQASTRPHSPYSYKASPLPYHHIPTTIATATTAAPGPHAYPPPLPAVISSTRSSQYIYPSAPHHIVDSQQGSTKSSISTNASSSAGGGSSNGSSITQSSNTPASSSRIGSVRLNGPAGSLGAYNSPAMVSRADTPNAVVTHYYATNPADFSIS
ncbi:hypothetical protein PMKS-003306 [Pichia membranifaciens]|uniref:Uncharacterized protein n=1 Tax=Pichia membranifaciens TaxID=4926 RepID=A0A1Q2YJT1_9ASCO|nr:hypothetical protein PMKS-003306 [Pichia membranifaciens]